MHKICLRNFLKRTDKVIVDIFGDFCIFYLLIFLLKNYFLKSIKKETGQKKRFIFSGFGVKLTFTKILGSGGWGLYGSLQLTKNNKPLHIHQVQEPRNFHYFM